MPNEISAIFNKLDLISRDISCLKTDSEVTKTKLGSMEERMVEEIQLRREEHKRFLEHMMEETELKSQVEKNTSFRKWVTGLFLGTWTAIVGVFLKK